MTDKNSTPLKFVISGYYGHDNFGDEAILSVILTELEKNFDDPLITVISSNSKTCKVDAVYKYNLFGIWQEISSCDVFISGGGSLLQDATSFRSLLYYLSLLFFAQIRGKKTFIYAQGIGPLKGSLARFLTTYILKKVNFITVRDKNSQELLSSIGIQSEITADSVWGLENTSNKSLTANLKIGIQLRKWKSLNGKELNLLAATIISNFNDINAEIELISLHPSEDAQVLERFYRILEQNNFKQKITLLSGLGLNQIINHINNLDLLIAMRYHAGLVAAKCGVPFLVLAYDPKVKSLAKETFSPFISIDELDFYRLDKAINYLISKKDSIKTNLEKISTEKSEESGKTVTYLKNMLEKNYGKE